MTRCIMLDVDGVLIDGRPEDGRNWSFSLQDDLGIDPSVLIEAFFKKSWTDIVTGKRDLLPELSLVLDQMPVGVTAKELVKYWFEMDSRIVAPVLRDCRAARQSGMSVFLATNQEHLRARYLMQTLGLERDVDGIIYSAQAGVRKPDAELFEHAARISGFQPEDLLFVDDTAKQMLWRLRRLDGAPYIGRRAPALPPFSIAMATNRVFGR